MKFRVLPFICIALALAFTSDANCQSKFKCGEEYRLITKDNHKHQGELVKNNGDSLSLINSKVITIALDNVESASIVKRHARIGAILGAAAGTIIAVSIVNAKSEGEIDLDGIGYSFGGTFFGGVLGYIIGRTITSHQEIELELLPLCSSASGHIIPVRLSLTYRF